VYEQEDSSVHRPSAPGTGLHGEREWKIRLYAIDCPEKRRGSGNGAGRFTSHLVLGNVVEVQRKVVIE
jgi:endonuclease YncB( thermonuclease family)